MALPNFPIDEAYLVGGWLASALWGKDYSFDRLH